MFCTLFYYRRSLRPTRRDGRRLYSPAAKDTRPVTMGEAGSSIVGSRFVGPRVSICCKPVLYVLHMVSRIETVWPSCSIERSHASPQVKACLKAWRKNRAQQATLIDSHQENESTTSFLPSMVFCFKIVFRRTRYGCSRLYPIST